jgi:YHS domain-containing protein
MPKMNGNKKFPVTLGAKRYYLCGEKVAMMFATNPDKYLPGWFAAQGIEVKATQAALESLGGGMEKQSASGEASGGCCD